MQAKGYDCLSVYYFFHCTTLRSSLSHSCKYSGFFTLTNETILKYVDKILVHGPRRVGGMKIQPVEIILKHIGKVDLPEEEPPVPLTGEELVAEKRRRRQEYDHRYYYEKRKPKMAAAKAAQAPEPDGPTDSEP